MFWRRAFFTLLALNVGYFGFYLAPAVSDRYYRHHLGFEGNRPALFDAVEAQARRRLHSRAADGRTETLIAKGLVEAQRGRTNPQNTQSLQRYADRLLANDGRFKKPIDELDVAPAGETLLYLYSQGGGDGRYEAAAHQLLSYLLGRAASERTLAYRDQDHRETHLVDTIGLVCPFLARCGAVFNNRDATDLAVRLITDYMRFGLESKTGLPFHGYDPSDDHSPVGAVGWGRGTGWYAVGLIDTLEVLSNEDPRRATLAKEALRLAKVIRTYERPDGGWGSLIASRTKLETSGTAMLGYFLMKGIRLNVLDGSYRPVAERALEAIRLNTRPSGLVDNAEGMCKAPNQASSERGPSSYAQGMTLSFLAQY